MSRPSTSRDMQRVTFVESLHSSLKKQDARVLAEHNKFVTLASSYIDDGLDEKECIELLMIDGIARESAESYASMALDHEKKSKDTLADYSFQFEDNSGRILSSYDINKTVKAANDDDAWTKAEEFLFGESDVDPQKLLAVNRID